MAPSATQQHYLFTPSNGEPFMSLLTSTPISQLAVELLRRQIVLPATVSRVPGAEYGGPSGGTVTIRVPQPRSAKKQETPGAAIEYSDIDEVPVNVSLSHLYDATRVSDEDLSLTLQDFGRQVLRPQVSAVATGAEDELAEAMNGLSADSEIEWAAEPDPAADEDTILAVRERMGDADVPAGNRYCAVSTDVARRLLAVDAFTRADARGAAGVTALEQATLGALYGFQFVESSAVEKGSAVFYHSSGFGFGNRAPVAPTNGADSRTASEGGVSLRSILMFDAGHLSTASVVSVFAGAAVVPEDDEGTVTRAVRVATASD